ncbi:hypothetical protein IGI04_001554 [Brassica rapa subsp. trilocularis]|uniref:Legume lectin domain-containing protein n=1 Tax=Brassica rapa subsp. trilocularis TaxID=1813537 RepID=A0ABQ7NSZ3_BRACM|nr:hypothetical protein IGI04_001554 [Brassica rapa subsp. trilocularis]
MAARVAARGGLFFFLTVTFAVAPVIPFFGGPFSLNRFSVQRVYTVTVGRTGGGNLQAVLPNDGIVARRFSLVPSEAFQVWVVFSEALGAVVSRFEGAFLSGSSRCPVLNLD